MELDAKEGGGAGDGYVGEDGGAGYYSPEEQPQSDGGKDVGEDGSERAEVSTNVATVAAAGEKRHIVL